MYGDPHVLYLHNAVRKREHLLSLQENKPLLRTSCGFSESQVRRKNQFNVQRPLTSYLPIRSDDFDLRQHVENSGHQTDHCPHVSVSSVTCKGTLLKLGVKWCTWKKRWFVFDRTRGELLYYASQRENKLKGGIPFQSIQEVYVDHLQSVKSPDPQSTFCVKTKDRKFFLMAPSPEAMRIWVNVIFTGAEGYLEFQKD